MYVNDKFTESELAMKKITKSLVGVVILGTILTSSMGTFAEARGSNIPTSSYNLLTANSDYCSSAYINGYRLYTNYYFYGGNNICNFYGTSYNASGSYYVGVINYDTGYTYLNYRPAGASEFNIQIRNSDSAIYPIGSKYYCGFNMTQTAAEASIAFGVGSFAR